MRRLALAFALLLGGCAGLKPAATPPPPAEAGAAPAPAIEAQAPPAADSRPTEPPPFDGEKIEIKDPLRKLPTIDRTVPPDDLWERIRRGFAIQDLDNKLVQDIR